MKMNALTHAVALPDDELLARIDALARTERETSAELVAHLAALDLRPSLFEAKGFGSLFGYCTQELRLSEDAACNRITAARACRRFPEILDLLASGAMTLTSVRMLAKHLTAENHRQVLARATGRTRPEIEALVAELAPQPDLPSSVRRLPMLAAAVAAVPTVVAPPDSVRQEEVKLALEPAIGSAPPVLSPASRPVVRASAPERYRVQFTIGETTHAKLRRLQALLRREIPDGDPATIFDRAVTLMLETVERKKLGAPAKPRKSTLPKPSLSAIRPGADKPSRTHLNWQLRTPIIPSRYIPAPARRGSWERDDRRCAFVSEDGRRCTEEAFIDFHHIDAHAKGGLPTLENMSLRCWRHNQYEAERVFGRRRHRSGEKHPSRDG
jgi:hypothetical protein